MKILLLLNSSLWDGRLHSRRLYVEFIYRLKEYCDFKVYGPNEHKYNSKETTPIEYNSKINAKDLVNLFNPDVILSHHYHFMKNWIPKDIRTLSNTPVVHFEMDFHFIDNKNWWKDMGFNLVLSRDFVFSVKGIESVWVPLSADDVFYTDLNTNYIDNRINKVLFIGNNPPEHKYYTVRRLAIKTLKEANLIDDKSFQRLNKNNEEIESLYLEYPHLLKQYRCGLSCAGGVLHSGVGKIYETMASGTALLTQYFQENEILFGKERCFFTYKDDCSDIVSQANIILNDIDQVKEVTQNALSVINKYHLEHYRLLEFRDILNAFIEGKEVPKRWGT